MGKDCGNIPQKVEELPKYNKLRYQVPAIFADTTKNYGSRTNGKIKKGGYIRQYPDILVSVN